MAAPATDGFEIAPAFAVPLITARLKEPDSLNQELAALFHSCAEQGDKFRNPDPFVYRNKALYESNFTLFDWPQDCIRRLREFCYANLYRAIGELNGYDVETLQRLHIASESWFHLTARGGYFGAHNHPMHSWSGVYCVRHDGDDPESDSGRLTFINPHATSTMFLDMATARMRLPYGIGPRKFRLQAGQLLLFPSWMLHEVLPYEGDTERITVAFNARFRLTGEQPRPAAQP